MADERKRPTVNVPDTVLGGQTPKNIVPPPPKPDPRRDKK